MSDFGVVAIARAEDSTAGAWPVEAEFAVRGEGGPLEVLVESAQRQPRLSRKYMLCAGREQDEVARSELPRRCAGGGDPAGAGDDQVEGCARPGRKFDAPRRAGVDGG